MTNKEVGIVAFSVDQNFPEPKDNIAWNVFVMFIVLIVLGVIRLPKASWHATWWTAKLPFRTMRLSRDLARGAAGRFVGALFHVGIHKQDSS